MFKEKFPKNIWQALLMILITIITLVTINTLDLKQNISEFISVVIGFLIIGSIVIGFFNYTPLSAIKFSKAHCKLILPIALISLCIQIVFLMPIYYLLTGSDKYQNLVIDTELRFYSVAFIIILGPIFEEFLFRDFVLRRLLKSNSVRYSIIVSSLVFSLIHLTIETTPMTLVLGLFTGYIYYKTKNVYLCSIFHIVNNAVGQCLYIYYKNFSISKVDHISEIYGENTYFIMTIAITLSVIVFFWVLKYKSNKLIKN